MCVGKPGNLGDNLPRELFHGACTSRACYDPLSTRGSAECAIVHS